VYGILDVGGLNTFHVELRERSQQKELRRGTVELGGLHIHPEFSSAVLCRLSKDSMNKNIIIAAIALLAITGTVSVRSQPQRGAPTQSHWAVVFYASDGANGGLVIYGLSSGGPAPAVKLGDEVGPTLSKLMDAGGIVNHTGDGLVYTITY